MAVDGVARSIDRLEVLPQAERTVCRTRRISHFSPPWQISDLEKPDQPEATELDARPVERLHAGADDYLITRFDKNELLARIQVGLRILELYSTLAKRVKELERAAGEIDHLKLRFPL
jgi:hypothetical protein